VIKVEISIASVFIPRSFFLKAGYKYFELIKKGPLSINPFEVENLKFEGVLYASNFKFSTSKGFILRGLFLV
jgi:hypothetical protein